MILSGGAWAGSFTKRNNDIFSIWANHFDRSAWGAAELVETDDTGDAAFPQIAIDSNGNYIAVWHQNNGSGWDIWSNRFD